MKFPCLLQLKLFDCLNLAWNKSTSNSHLRIQLLCFCNRIFLCSKRLGIGKKKSFDVQEELTSAHHSLGRMERELWAAEDKIGPRKRVANPWQVNV